MSTILITGIGLTSLALGKHLVSMGHSVNYLSRNTRRHKNAFEWDISKDYIDIAAFKNTTYIIHLAGAGIADKRWSKNRKVEISESRIASTQLLYHTIKKHNIQLKAFIATSAIGFYGAISQNKPFIESAPSANDFLGKLCSQWEKSIKNFNKLNIRTVIFRTGVVFTPQGGAFEKITTPIKYNMGTALGSGNQIIPWIHVSDLCKMYEFAINNLNITGIYNAVAPSCNSNSEITHTIATILKKSIWLPNIPTYIIKIIFGKMSKLILYGSEISSEKILKTGFVFKFNTLEEAIEDLICI